MPTMNYSNKPPLHTPILWQSIAYFFDNFDTTDLGWITSANYTLYNSCFRTQWVICSYETSGSYGRTPRYIFYALTLLSILARRTNWVVTVALVTVILYSSTASIHAIVLAVAAMIQLTTRLALVQKNYEVVLIDGLSHTGYLEQGLKGGPVWLPVLPLVYEPDADAVLAIVGFAFLFLLPMQVRSETLRNATHSQKTIVFAWSILLFLGLVSAFLIDIYVTIWFFPQLRFCPLDQTDILPLISNGPPTGLESWNGEDIYRWNRTIRDHFVFNNSSALFPNKCVCPCSEIPWPVRDSTDIIVDNYSLSDRPPISTEFVIALYIAACIIVGLFAGASLTLSIMIQKSGSFEKINVTTIYQNLYQAWSSEDKSWLLRYWRLVASGWLLSVVTFAHWPSIAVNLFFIGVKEYSIWWGGMYEESFRNIGQWGVLVATVLLFGGILSAQGERESPSETRQLLPILRSHYS